MGNNKEYLSSRPIPDILTAELDLISEGSRVLEIGIGTGRILEYIGKTRKNVHLIGIENDSGLAESARKSLPQAEIIYIDALSSWNIRPSVDFVISVNTIHEVVASRKEEERKRKFESFVAQTVLNIARNGELLLFDGLMPTQSEREVELVPKNQDGVDSFLFFAQTYLAKGIDYAKTQDNHIHLTQADLFAFFTKFPYLRNPELWRHEKTQFYPFLALDDIEAIIKGFGFDVLSVVHPNTRRGLDRFLQQYSVVEFDRYTFPQVQFLMKARQKY